MRPSLLLIGAMLGLGACSALRPAPPIERDAEYRLDRGLAALDAGSYREAFDDLAWVYSHCPDRARGAEALIAMAALELDPRNQAGRPAVATDLLGRVVREPAPAAYVRPVAESMYLMAIALGAPPAPAALTGTGPAVPPSQVAPAPVRDSTPRGADTTGVLRTRAADVLDPPAEEPAEGCGPRIAPEDWVAPRLPQLPGPSLVALLAESERARNASAAETSTLRAELEATRQRLAETEAELERIRRTLRP